MPRLLFLDESGDPGDPTKSPTKYFIIGGAIFSDEDWIELQKQLNHLKNINKIDPWVETKWRHIYQIHPKAKNPLSHLSVDERVAFAIDYFKIIRKTRGLRLVATVTDKSKAYKKRYIQKPEDIYEHTLVPTIERFHYFLGEHQHYGVVIQDQRGYQQDKHLRKFFQDLIKKGTYWTKFPRIIEGIFLTSSKYSVGIQSADFCVGALFRKYEKGDNTYLEIINNKFTGKWYKAQKGGLKFWP